MKINKVISLIVIFFVALFSVSLEVDAAQELTCIYENDTRIVQSSDGHLQLYNLVDNGTGGRWVKVDTFSNRDIEFKIDSSFYSTSLSNCPSYSRKETNIVYLYDKKTFLNADYSLEGGSDYSIPVDPTYKELSCLYEKKGSSNNRNFDKVLLTQDKNGIISIYKNKEDVALDDYSSYWKKEVNDYKFDDPSLKKDSNGGLTSCPQSKTSLVWPNTGEVEFFGDSLSGEEKLIENYDEVVNVLTFNKNTLSDVDTLGSVCDFENPTWLSDFDESKYTGSCLYQSETKWGCHVLELNLSTKTVDVIDSFSGKKLLNGENYFSTVDRDSLLPQKIQNSSESTGCPLTLMVKINEYTLDDYDPATNDKTVEAKIGYGANIKGELYGWVDARGNNMFTGEKLEVSNEIKIQFTEIKNFVNCEDLFDDEGVILGMLSTCVTLVKILIPMLLFVLGSLDFAKAVFSGSEDGMKKAQSKFIKRVIIAVVIFLIPSLLHFVLVIANSIWGNISTDLCGLL